jgi:hypothetical protein
MNRIILGGIARKLIITMEFNFHLSESKDKLINKVLQIGNLLVLTFIALISMSLQQVTAVEKPSDQS